MRDRRVAGIILAAGLGRRMGQNKATLAWPGSVDLLQHVVATTSAWTDEVVAVVAPLSGQTDRVGVQPAVNPDPSRGIASSLRVGLHSLAARGTWSGVGVVLVDQPFVTALDGLTVRERWECRGPGIRAVRPIYENIPGHPVLLEWNLALSLVGQLQKDQGLGRCLRGRRDVVCVHIPTHDRISPGLDLDRREEYARAIKWLVPGKCGGIMRHLRSLDQVGTEQDDGH
jgi:CTP:molybdopterin cytidylyltransferase MocA